MAVPGTVAPAYYADIIAVDVDLLEDIRVMESVSFVMNGAKVVKVE